MATVADIIARVRRELGDVGQPFRVTAQGDGAIDRVETGCAFAVTGLRVSKVASGELVDVTDYAADPVNGVLFLAAPLGVGEVLLVDGKTWALFSDEELTGFVNDAVLQHCAGRTTTERYRASTGFIQYATEELTLESLPEVEEVLVGLLATIEALWALTTDASTDVDISTADGTHVPRSQRYGQMRSQIDVLTEKYRSLCAQLNVGLYRIEVSNLRRVSRTNNRLVPLYIEREYDDHSMPIRELPPIDRQHPDYDGPASPVWGYS